MAAKRFAMAGVLLATVAGCCQPMRDWCKPACPDEAAGPPQAEVLPPPVVQASYPPVLLFDRVPGRYSATDFACRSDWPSTTAYYAPGQVITFREHFIDYQGPGRHPWYSTYRRFETRRYGVGYR